MSAPILGSLAVLTVAGFTGGFIGSQVGAGALFLYPALLYLGLSVPEAVATQSIAGLFINGIAAYRYDTKAKITYKPLIPLAIAASLGSVLGAKLLFVVNPQVLSTIFAAVFCVLALFVIIETKSLSGTKKSKPVSSIAAMLVCFVIGLYGGMIAVAVTTLAILFFSGLLKQPYIKAIASAVLIVTIFQVFQIAVFVADARINYAYALMLLPGTIVGAYLGSKQILTRSIMYFKVLIAIVTVIVVIKLLQN